MRKEPILKASASFLIATSVQVMTATPAARAERLKRGWQGITWGVSQEAAVLACTQAGWTYKRTLAHGTVLLHGEYGGHSAQLLIDRGACTQIKFIVASQTDKPAASIWHELSETISHHYGACSALFDRLSGSDAEWTVIAAETDALPAALRRLDAAECDVQATWAIAPAYIHMFTMTLAADNRLVAVVYGQTGTGTTTVDDEEPRRRQGS